MRQVFAHEAVIVMEPDADVQAPGAAITVALCGHWEHEPPCPLAPHHCSARRVNAETDDEVHVRVLFAVEPDAENVTRTSIEQALSGGRLQSPDGSTNTYWQLRHSQPSDPSDDEAEHAEYLLRA